MKYILLSSLEKSMFWFYLFFIYFIDASEINVIEFLGNGIKDHGNIRLASLRSASKELEQSEEITICSSIFMKSFIMEQSLFQVLDKTKAPWFSLYFLQLDEKTMTHPFSLAVDGIYTHLTQIEAHPLQWNHACIG